MVGLKGVEYMDSLQDKKRLMEGGDSITFTDELDRIYLQTPDVLEVSTALHYLATACWWALDVSLTVSAPVQAHQGSLIPIMDH